MEIPSVTVGPLFLQIAGSDRDLIGTGRDRGLELDPVGVVGNDTIATGEHIVHLGRAVNHRQLVLAPQVAVEQLGSLSVAKAREILPVVEERSVIDDRGVRAVVAEARVVDRQVEAQLHPVAGGERLVELVDGVTVLVVAQRFRVTGELQFVDRIIAPRRIRIIP